MSESTRKNRRGARIREGASMIVISVVSAPIVMRVLELLPSRENTSIDELPQLAATTALVVFGAAGVARLVRGLMTPTRSSATPNAVDDTRPSQLTSGRMAPQASVHKAPPQPVRYDTPV